MNVQLIDKKKIIFSSTLALIHQDGFYGPCMSMIAKYANKAISIILFQTYLFKIFTSIAIKISMILFFLDFTKTIVSERI